MYKILFICTDNVGRSLTAKYLFEDWLRKNNRDDIAVSSAGINATSDVSSFTMDHIGKLKEMGVDVVGYTTTQLTYEVLKEHNLAIVMDTEEQLWVREKFNVEIPLYNEIYKNEKTPVLITVPGMTETISERLLKMVDYIAQSIPVLAEKIDEMVKGSDQNNKNIL
jgi:protein-tyrosine-phosphatase